MDVPDHRDHVLRRAVPGILVLPLEISGGVRPGQPHLDIVLGTINTAVLITSSLTMVLAVQGAQTGNRRRLTRFLFLTILLGLVFLTIKGVEYHAKWVEHHVPGPHFDGHPPTGRPNPGGASFSIPSISP